MNSLFCTLVEGKTPADLIAFKAEYEKAVDEAGLAGYELRVPLPAYSSDIGNGKFVWDGSWPRVRVGVSGSTTVGP